MGMRLHLRREIENRVSDSRRRNFDAAAKQFTFTQQDLAAKNELDVKFAIKALNGSIGKPAGKTSAKRTAGTGVQEQKPRLKFDPSAKRKPGQVLKLHVTAADLLDSGDDPNWGWVDPPKKSEKSFEDFIRETNSKPQIVVNYVDKNVRTGDYQEAKALGQRLVATNGDIGSRAARAAGFIVDALGKLRCPPGTPAANQFTNERGENCFSPVEVLRDIASGISNIIGRQHANRISAAERTEILARLAEEADNLGIARGLSSRNSRRGIASSSQPAAGLVFRNESEVLDWWEANPEHLVLMSQQQQIEIRQLLGARKSIAGTPATLQAARDRIDNSLDALKRRFNVTESEVDNADLFALLDAGFDLNDPLKIGLDWQEIFTGLDAKPMWDPTLSLQENLTNRKQLIRQQLIQFLDGQQAIRFKGKKASDALAAGDPDVETVLANMFGYLDAAERGNLKAIFDTFNNAVPGEQLPLTKIKSFFPPDDNIGALTEAIGNNQIQISFNKLIALNAWRHEDVLEALNSGLAFNLTAIGPQSDSVKYDQINQALRSASNLYEYLSITKNIYNMDLAGAFHGSMEAAFSQVAFHELNHADLYVLARKQILDVYAKYGVVTFWSESNEPPIRLTADPMTWDNETWAGVMDSAAQGAMENLPDDFPPADLQQFELASLHLLTGAYSQENISNAIRDRNDGLGPIADVMMNRLAAIEVLAEIAGLQKMGILGGDIIEDALGKIDDALGRTTIPRPAFVPFAPTVPIPKPTVFNKPYLPGQAPKQKPSTPSVVPNVPSGGTNPLLPSGPSGSTRPNVPNLPVTPATIIPASNTPVQQAVDDILYVTGDVNAHDRLDEMFGFDKTPYHFLAPAELDLRFELLQEEANRLIALGYGNPPYGSANTDRTKEQFRLFLALTGMKQIANQNKSRRRLGTKGGSQQSNSRFRWVRDGKNPNPGKYYDTELYFGTPMGGLDLTDVRKLQSDMETHFRTNKTSPLFGGSSSSWYDDPMPPRPRYRSGGRGSERIMGTPQNNHVPTRGRNDALKASGTHAIALDSQLTTPQREALTADLQTRSGIFGNVEDLQTAISGSASIRKANGLGVFDVNPPTGKTTGDLIDEELDMTIRALEAIDKSKIDQPVKARVVLDGIDSSSVGRDDIVQTTSISQGALLSEEQIEVSKTIPHTSDGSSAIIHMPTGSSVAFGAEQNSSIYDTVTLPPGSFKVIDVDKDGVIHLIPVSQESKDSYLSNLLGRVEMLDTTNPGERNEKKRLKKRIYDNLNRYKLDDRANNVTGSQPESRDIGYTRDTTSSANSHIANNAINEVHKTEKVQILNTDDGWIQQTFPDGNSDESIKTISTFGHKIMTPDARRSETRVANMQRISKLRENLDTGNLLGLNHADAADIDPQVEEFIRTHTDEDVLNYIQDAATTYANGFDDRVRISVNNEQLDELLNSGSMPMFGDKDSSHIGVVQRRELETTLGYPNQVPAGVRTVSGWIEHSRNDSERLAHIEQKNRLNPEKVLQSADPGLLSNDSGFQPAGNQLNITGDVEIVLRPEVAQRSSWTMGDPIRREDGSYPSKLFGGSPEDILQAMTSSDDDRGIARIHELIRAGITGDWSGIQTAHHLTKPNRGGVSRSEHLATRQGDSSIHIEAIIHGPVNMEHVDYIKMPLSTLEAGSSPKDIRLDPKLMGSKDKRVIDALRAAGLEDYQIDWFFENSNLLDDEKSSDLRSVINARNFTADIKDRYGVDIRLSNSDGMDLLNAETHRELASGTPNGDTAEQVLYEQIKKDLIRNAPDWAKRIKEKSSAAGVQPSDKPAVQTMESVSKPSPSVPDSTSRSTGLASRILKRNQQVADAIEAAGAKLFDRSVKSALGGYDPDAQDGDGDGIVQNGTPMEWLYC